MYLANCRLKKNSLYFYITISVNSIICVLAGFSSAVFFFFFAGDALPVSSPYFTSPFIATTYCVSYIIFQALTIRHNYIDIDSNVCGYISIGILPHTHS